MRTLNAAGLDLLIQLEGIKLFPYLDSAKIPTIGIGSTKYEDGKPVTMQDKPITEDYAFRLMEFNLKKDSEDIEKFLKEKGLILNENEFSALLCFSYNVGCGPIINQGKALCRAIMSHNEEAIRAAFVLYNKIHDSKGNLVALDGLTKRRKMEADLYFS